jgi:hypothetical protein
VTSSSPQPSAEGSLFDVANQRFADAESARASIDDQRRDASDRSRPVQDFHAMRS